METHSRVAYWCSELVQIRCVELMRIQVNDVIKQQVNTYLQQTTARFFFLTIIFWVLTTASFFHFCSTCPVDSVSSLFTVQNRDRWAAMNIFVVMGFHTHRKGYLGGNLQCLRLGTSVAWLWDERNMRSAVYIHPLTTMYDPCSVMWSGGLVNKAAPLWDFDPAFSALLCYLH